MVNQSGDPSTGTRIRIPPSSLSIEEDKSARLYQSQVLRGAGVVAEAHDVRPAVLDLDRAGLAVVRHHGCRAAEGQSETTSCTV